MTYYTAPSVETEYAGCRFRSRLEARWAVFFDHANIEWVYEPDRFQLSSGRTYLPDFYLPETGAWAEVKGSDAALDVELMYLAAQELPRSAMGYNSGATLLILGPIPRERFALSECGYGHDLLWAAPQTNLIENEDGALLIHRSVNWWRFGRWEKAGGLWFDAPMDAGSRRLTVSAARSEAGVVDERVAEAYRHARKARFEHGDEASFAPRSRHVTYATYPTQHTVTDPRFPFAMSTGH